MRGLRGKTAIVTGSYSGIGEATAQRLAAEGAKVALANSNQARGEEAAARIRETGAAAAAIRFDLTDEESIQALFAETAATFGTPTILVNSAAITHGPIMARDNAVERLEREIWEKAFDVNATGTMLMIKTALPHMVAAGGARSSTSARALRRRAACSALPMPRRKRRSIRSPAMSPRSMERRGCAATPCLPA